MSAVATPAPALKYMLEHKDLPKSDGLSIGDFTEYPLSILLADTLGPILKRPHPNEQYPIEQEQRQAVEARQNREGLAARLRGPGLDPDTN